MDKRFFNIAGPCDPLRHYMLPAGERLSEIHGLIDNQQYFVIHAARQSGKTTLLKNLSSTLNAGTQYHALYCSLEGLQGIEDQEKGVPAIVKTIAASLEFHRTLSGFPFGKDADMASFTTVLKVSLMRFCSSLDRPLVLLFDEADCLCGATMIGFLRQLRDGYVNRPEIPFVHSLALVGMRDIRDFKAKVREGRDSLGSASPFNIVTKSMTLRNFTEVEVASLYGQHTADTGQIFETEAVAKAYELSQGQPWLVNAMAREAVVEILENDKARAVTAKLMEQSSQNIILRRDTHIDSLLERLKESRVRRIVEPMILGKEWAFDQLDDDYRYCVDLGLIRRGANGIEPANPIYGEVMLRTLTYNAQNALGSENYDYPRPKYLRPDGSLDMSLLLQDFQEFWRENSEIWVERFDYKEAAPHLILMAFLQRVVNGGGRVLREMATGRMRLDLCAEFNQFRYPVELKLDYGIKTLPSGIKQLSAYMGRLGCQEGWLIVFSQDSAKSWDDRITWRTEILPDGKTLHILGC